MQELITVQVAKFVRNINEKKKRNTLYKKVVHQTLDVIGCSL